MTKPNRKQRRKPEMLQEYDFRGGVRGKYAAKLTAQGSNIVVLEPDVAKAFPTSAAVNQALRAFRDMRESLLTAIPGRRRRAG